MARLMFQGATGEVTGSRYLLTTDPLPESHQLLLECGMHQGGRDADGANRESLAGLASTVSAVILSHGHLDHAGLVPKLVREGYRGPIHCTTDTLALMEIMWADAAFVMARDLEWENRWRERSERPLLEPLYDEDDVSRALGQCVTHGYGAAVMLPGEVQLVFRDAGHILGSAIVELNIPSGGRSRRLVFSGDLGNPDAALMHTPEKIRNADYVLLESTYGDRDHRPMDATIEEFARVLQTAQEAGGNVLIPAFAVGRTQELLFHLSLFHHQGRLPQQMVFLDSPMAIRVTELYRSKRDALNDADVKALQTASGGDEGQELPGLRLTRTVEESMAINRIHGGAIIMAGSGMCEGGRILHHLRHNLPRRGTQLVIVGFQAEGTLGRQLVDGAEQVRIRGERIPVNATIHTIGGFSAHAGQADLLGWAGAFQDDPEFFLVHGEPGARDALAAALAEAGMSANVPALNDVLEL